MPNAETNVERRPEEVGVSSARLARALAILDTWVEQGRVPGVAAVAIRRGAVVARHFRGHSAPEATPGEPRPIGSETLFPLASVTKPISATGFMLLVEAGEVTLDDPVIHFVPEFGKLGKEQVRIRHLLSHTSGLPDVLPNNESLRRAHSNTYAFVRSTYRQELAFNPGTRILNSSLESLILAEVVERLTKQAFPDFAAERIFRPLRLQAMGFRPAEALHPRIVRLRLPEGRAATDWDINSLYWRQLGAPWSGIFASADDLGGFGQAYLDAWLGTGAAPDAGAPIISQVTARLMTQDHTKGLAGLSGAPEAWGLGWAIPARQPIHWAGDLASPETFGHVGATGAMLWIDPVRELVCVVLTNQVTNWALEHRRFACFSNALQAAVVG